MSNPLLVKRITYEDLTRLEVDRFHDRSGISMVAMAQMNDAKIVDADETVTVDWSKVPDFPLHKHEMTLLFLAVQRKIPAATWEQALGGDWEWNDDEAGEDDAPKGGGKKKTGG